MSGWALVRQAVWRARTLVLTVAVILAGFQWLMTVIAGTVESMGAFRQIVSMLPAAVRRLLGDSLVPMMSFAGVVTIGYFHLVVQTALLALAIGLCTQTASDIELRIVDLLMARPVSRAWLVWRSVVSLLTATLMVLAFMALGTWSGLHLFAPSGVDWPSPSLVFSLAVNLALLMLAFGGIALAIASLSRRRVVAASIAGILAFVAFLVDYAARIWDPMKRVAWLSPFHYVSQIDLLTGNPLAPRDVVVLLGIFAASLAIALLAITRRDL